MRRLMIPLVAAAALLVTASPALACGGLIGPNGAVNLLRTTTFAGYHDGVEHYVTSFEFAGGEGEFGSIVPLPDVPTDVVRGGDWTLQRLVLETQPAQRGGFFLGAAAGAADSAQVLLETKIDALEITILRGGGDEVGLWAADHGFRLPPDAPEVLDFYAERSPIFMAARFDADAARERGQNIGDGTPVHLTIPTDNPWVPLRILALGRQAAETVQADVFLLTDERPALLPDPGSVLGVNGLSLDHAAPATGQLLADLRSDKGMKWVPDSAWLTKVTIDTAAPDLRFDLAIDASGLGQPSLQDAGFAPFGPAPAPVSQTLVWVLLVAFTLMLPLGGVALVAYAARGARLTPPPAGA
ncbi:MAG TPA: DUF2330 domain-containing protein [Candidatus Limnocylindria bacterium]|jgi:hypothetical protein|nr:DUF2330 domain-containing protein [Candidatus Limnocylindria bacterium]